MLLPTDEQYSDVQLRYPVPQLKLIAKRALLQFNDKTTRPFAEHAIQDRWIHLSNRMIHARQAYHLMRHFFELGIPDDRPAISPGYDGASVTYFPDFVDADYSKKAWFDFYFDAFSAKLFSAWDAVGQLLCEAHELTIKRPSFDNVVSLLAKGEVQLGIDLRAIWNQSEFQSFCQLRHDATHNFLPGTFGGVVHEEIALHTFLADGQGGMPQRAYSFGVGKYVRSCERVRLADDALDAFANTLFICKLSAQR